MKIEIEFAYTLTGKVLADFTVDYCKTLANAAVSQTSMTLTEIAFGVYVLDNPNVVVDTILRMHLTADATQYVTTKFSLSDGNTALEASGNVAAIKTQSDKLAFTVTNKVDANVYTWNGTAVAAPATAGYPVVTNKVGAGTGELDLTSGVIKANLAQILGTALTETATYLAAGFKKFFNVATPTGTLNSIPDAVAGATNGISIVGSTMALSSDYDFAKGTVAMTEAYAADGAAATPAQALHMIWSMLAEKSVSSTTMTCKKLDGSTTSMTFTLNDAYNPTSITRIT
jgi:hypothetical protein